jgi:O-succinylbenzoic acid--CoA ligase
LDLTSQHITIKNIAYDFEALQGKLATTEGFEREVFAFAAAFLNPSTTEISVRTSGSTGTPKTIVLSKEKMRNSARMTCDFFDLQPGDNALLCLSPSYIAGKMMLVRSIERGMNLWFTEPSSNPLQALEDAPKMQFTAMVPMQVEACLSDVTTLPQLGQIEQIIVGGGVVSASLLERMQGLPNRLFATYGMTETITHVAVRPLNGPDASEIYTALNGVRLWQDDRDCLIIRAPHLCTEELITNDVVELEDFHQFRWLGRIDNVVNSGGVKLFPEQIEKKLTSFMDRRFILVGTPDELLGEKLILLIEGEPLDTVTAKLLQGFMSDHLDRFEVPKEVRYVTQFAETGTGKIQRRKSFELLSGE